MKKIVFTSSFFDFILIFFKNIIKIDGFFNDWNTSINTYVDDSSDSQGVELLDFSVCNDDVYLYVKISFGSEVDLTNSFIILHE